MNKISLNENVIEVYLLIDKRLKQVWINDELSKINRFILEGSGRYLALDFKDGCLYQYS